MKKLLMSLGTIAAVAAPVAAVIACGTTNTSFGRALMNKAAKLKTEEKTDHNFIRVGGSSLRIIGDGIVNVNAAEDLNKTNKLGEFRAGDYFEFIFKDAADLENVQDNIIYFDGKENKTFDEITKKDGLFTLSVEQKNVIRLTLNETLNGEEILSGQKLIMKDFQDINKDGLVNDSDKGETLPFYITPDRFDNSNKFEEGKGFQPSTFYDKSEKEVESKGVHLPSLFKILDTREKDFEKTEKLASMSFEESDIKWGVVDLTKLKEGDVISFKADGMPQVCRVYIEDNKRKFIQSSGGVTVIVDQFGSMEITDATHIKIKNPYAGRAHMSQDTGQWETYPEFNIVEVTKMGEV